MSLLVSWNFERRLSGLCFLLRQSARSKCWNEETSLRRLVRMPRVVLQRCVAFFWSFCVWFDSSDFHNEYCSQLKIFFVSLIGHQWATIWDSSVSVHFLPADRDGYSRTRSGELLGFHWCDDACVRAPNYVMVLHWRMPSTKVPFFVYLFHLLLFCRTFTLTSHIFVLWRQLQPGLSTLTCELWPCSPCSDSANFFDQITFYSMCDWEWFWEHCDTFHSLLYTIFLFVVIPACCRCAHSNFVVRFFDLPWSI